MTEIKIGGGFLGLLAIVLITLKLLGKIDLSWWLVTAPLWGGVAVVVATLCVIAIGFTIVYGIIFLIELLRKKKD